MDKQTLLQQIKIFAQNKLITKEEINAVFDDIGQVSNNAKLNIAAILYYIGGAIVVLGIAVLCWQNWLLLTTQTKILVTFGSGIVAYCIGLLLHYDARFRGVANGFYLISSFILPVGLWIIFDKAGFDLASNGVQSLIFGALFLVQLFSYLVFRKTIFIVFAIIFSTVLFFCFTNFLIAKIFLDQEKFFEYRALLTGLTYLFLGYYFADSKKTLLTGMLYGFGAIIFLTAALALGGWAPQRNIFWELIFPGLAFGLMFLSVYLRHKVLLIVGSLYLMAYIVKITAEYFVMSLGWPLALVLVGFMLIIVGSLSFHFSKKYLSQP